MKTSYDLCSWMMCGHTRAAHGEGRCRVRVIDHNERRFSAEGDRLPPREVPCGCTWIEPTVVMPRLPREVIEESRHA